MKSKCAYFGVPLLVAVIICAVITRHEMPSAKRDAPGRTSIGSPAQETGQEEILAAPMLTPVEKGSPQSANLKADQSRAIEDLTRSYSKYCGRIPELQERLARISEEFTNTRDRISDGDSSQSLITFFNRLAYQKNALNLVLALCLSDQVPSGNETQSPNS